MHDHKTAFNHKPPAHEPIPPSAAAAHDSGKTRPQIHGEPAPRLPHERDESSDSQTGEPDPMVQQASLDLERGLVDTDRGPVMDKLYEEKVRPDDGETRDRAAPARRTP